MPNQIHNPISYPWALSADSGPGLVKWSGSGSAHRLECIVMYLFRLFSLWMLLCFWVPLLTSLYIHITRSFTRYLFAWSFNCFPTAWYFSAILYFFCILYQCTDCDFSWAFYISTLNSVFSVYFPSASYSSPSIYSTDHSFYFHRVHTYECLYFGCLYAGLGNVGKHVLYHQPASL